MKKEVQILFKVDGIDGYVTDLKDLQSALKKSNDATEDLSSSTDKLADSTKDVNKEVKEVNKSPGIFKRMGTSAKSAFNAIKTGIAATGIGLLIVAVGQLVEWFKETDTGAKIIQGTLAGLAVIFDNIKTLITPIGDTLTSIFTDPKQALIDFKDAFIENVTSKFNAYIDGLGLAGQAVKKFFSGDFTGAAEDAKSAANKMLVEATILGDVIDGVTTVVEATSEAFEGTTEKIKAAVTATTNLIDAKNTLLKLEQDLQVENANLTKQLEFDKKIAEDTTRAYQERKEALDRVNEANEQLAANNLILAAQREKTLQDELALATTNAERREIEQQLADATTARIEAEQQVGIVKLESERLSRELDIEERDRINGIKNLIESTEAENIENKREAALEAIRLAEEAAMQELVALKATEEEKQRVRDAFNDQRKMVLNEFNDEVSSILSAYNDDEVESELEKQKELLRIQYEADLEKLKQAGATAEQLKQLEEGYQNAVLKAEGDAAKKSENLEREKFKAKVDLAAQTISGITALFEAFQSEDEERAKKNFKIQKALNLAQATLTGITTVMNAYASASDPKNPLSAVPGYALSQAIIAGAFSTAQIVKIARSKFQGSTPDLSPGTGGGPRPGASVNYNFGQQGGGTIQPGQLVGGENQTQPIQAYVLANDVTSAQEANYQIENLSKF